MLFDKINLKFILNHQIDIFIFTNYKKNKESQITIKVIK